MLTNNVPDDCKWPEITSEAIAYCPQCGGEICIGETCYKVGDDYYCWGCVYEVVAGEG